MYGFFGFFLNFSRRIRLMFWGRFSSSLIYSGCTGIMPHIMVSHQMLRKCQVNSRAIAITSLMSVTSWAHQNPDLSKDQFLFSLIIILMIGLSGSTNWSIENRFSAEVLSVINHLSWTVFFFRNHPVIDAFSLLSLSGFTHCLHSGIPMMSLHISCVKKNFISFNSLTKESEIAICLDINVVKTSQRFPPV